LFLSTVFWQKVPLSCSYVPQRDPLHLVPKIEGGSGQIKAHQTGGLQTFNAYRSRKALRDDSFCHGWQFTGMSGQFGRNKLVYSGQIHFVPEN
jgi:hypothetical protein